MTFITAVKTCFSKYVTFSGRAQRSEYWWWALFTFLAGVVLSGIDGLLGNGQTAAGPLSGLFSLITFLPGLSVLARRLHDVNRSAWWMLLLFLPIIGWIVLLIWTVSKGSDGINRFGDDPLEIPYDAADYTSSVPNVTRD
nr:DUF805 domain-containing protein [uncultured Celeribacter sp.]